MYKQIISIFLVYTKYLTGPFFSWLLEKCGRDSQDFKGNSRDVFTAGMRNTAVMLIATAKHLGMDGLDLIHKAEREYVQLQFNILNDLKHKTGGL